MLSDMRYTTQLEEECPGFDVQLRPPGITMLQLGSARSCGQAGCGRLTVEADAMTYCFFRAAWRRNCRGPTLSDIGQVEELRQIKDRQEVQEIRRSVDLAQRAFAVVRAVAATRTRRRSRSPTSWSIRSASLADGVAASRRSWRSVPERPCRTRRRRSSGLRESDFVLIDWGAFGGAVRERLDACFGHR